MSSMRAYEKLQEPRSRWSCEELLDAWCPQVEALKRSWLILPALVISGDYSLPFIPGRSGPWSTLRWCYQAANFRVFEQVTFRT